MELKVSLMNNNNLVVITGGGRGIGAATAKLFAQHGYQVVINFKYDVVSAQAVENEINNSGGFCKAVQADVATEAGVEHLFTQVDQLQGQFCALVNNVGILQTQQRLEEISADRINAVLTNNVTSYFLCSREAIKRMSTKYQKLGGAIVNVSSGASRSGSPNEYVDYAASKGAIDTLTIGLSKEVANEGIRVNCVRPGLIYTDMHADGGEATRVDRLKHIIPMQRGGEPNEVANAIFWLASENASFTTGSFIDVTGGL